MKFATTIRPLANMLGLEHAASILSNAGFHLLDFTPKTAEEEFFVMRMTEKGIFSVYQTHSPYNRYAQGDIAEHKAAVAETLRLTARIGAKYFVIHGDEFDFEKQEYTADAALLYNYDYYAPIVEEAGRLGIRIAFENVFEDSKVRPRFCSQAEDLARLIDKFDAPHVCACWDTGHAAVAFRENQPDAISLLGSRIECTHIHDNYLNGDTHMIPFTGKINWQSCMSALKRDTKAEVLSLEFVYDRIPEGAAKEYAAFIYRAVSLLAEL